MLSPALADPATRQALIDDFFDQYQAYADLEPLLSTNFMREITLNDGENQPNLAYIRAHLLSEDLELSLHDRPFLLDWLVAYNATILDPEKLQNLQEWTKEIPKGDQIRLEENLSEILADLKNAVTNEFITEKSVKAIIRNVSKSDLKHLVPLPLCADLEVAHFSQRFVELIISGEEFTVQFRQEVIKGLKNFRAINPELYLRHLCDV